MSRIRTQEDFINRAKEIHNGKYDYSRVVYIKTSEKVTIVCPVHGAFEQTPHKHLRGQGCKLCGREQTRNGVDEFVRRARIVHGDRYDYSKVVYVATNKKVRIVCRVHGEFLQTPHSHVVLGQNCPMCAAMEGGLKRMGDNNVMRKPEIKEKAKLTCLSRYGAKTYAESADGRLRLHDIIVQPELQLRTRKTCLERYGAESWTQSVVGRQRLHEIWLLFT